MGVPFLRMNVFGIYMIRVPKFGKLRIRLETRMLLVGSKYCKLYRIGSKTDP